ncbi:MAG: hypothetical protein ACI8X5_002611 [Planctomycetota bacterium]|jgi:hypothetical protein
MIARGTPQSDLGELRQRTWVDIGREIRLQRELGKALVVLTRHNEKSDVALGDAALESFLTEPKGPARSD